MYSINLRRRCPTDKLRAGVPLRSLSLADSGLHVQGRVKRQRPFAKIFKSGRSARRQQQHGAQPVQRLDRRLFIPRGTRLHAAGGQMESGEIGSLTVKFRVIVYGRSPDHSPSHYRCSPGARLLADGVPFNSSITCSSNRGIITLRHGSAKGSALPRTGRSDLGASVVHGVALSAIEILKHVVNR